MKPINHAAHSYNLHCHSFILFIEQKGFCKWNSNWKGFFIAVKLCNELSNSVFEFVYHVPWFEAFYISLHMRENGIAWYSYNMWRPPLYWNNIFERIFVQSQWISPFQTEIRDFGGIVMISEYCKQLPSLENDFFMIK